MLLNMGPLATASLCIATAQWVLESLHSVRLAYFGHSCSVLELATIGSALLIKSWIQVRSGVSALERGIVGANMSVLYILFLSDLSLDGNDHTRLVNLD